MLRTRVNNPNANKLGDWKIDEYFMMSYCQDNVKLEYNVNFRLQLYTLVNIRNMK